MAASAITQVHVNAWRLVNLDDAAPAGATATARAERDVKLHGCQHREAPADSGPLFFLLVGFRRLPYQENQ